MKHLILDTNGLIVKKRENCFLIVSKKEKPRKISPHTIKSIIILADIYLSTASVHLANNHQIPLYYGDKFGNVHATLRSKQYKGRTDLRMNQVLWCKSDKATVWALHMINLKVRGQAQLLIKYNIIFEITEIGEGMTESGVRVKEAMMGKQYWTLYRTLLPKGWIMKSRNIRPAEDHVNAWINYFYGFMYTLVEQAIWANGLDPYFYVFHSNHYQNPALVYDMIEPFRPLVDYFVLNSIIIGDIDSGMIQLTAQGKFRITRTAKGIVIPKYLAYLKTHVTIDDYRTSIYKHVYRGAYNLRQIINTEEK
jgi:CRISPR-associated protein Cas1